MISFSVILPKVWYYVFPSLIIIGCGIVVLVLFYIATK